MTYVWVDALLNYVNGAGWGSGREEDIRDFDKWWRQAGAVHLIGKDILMTHGVYWPCLLMALDIPLPQTILAHGWLLNAGREKMSKSKGEKLDPLTLSEELGVSELRYFLAREIPLGSDAYISKEMMTRRIYQDLSDLPGNLLSRLARLVETGFEGKIPPLPKAGKIPLKDLAEKTALDMRQKAEAFHLSQALESVSALLTEVNRFLERSAPWKQIKTDRKAAGQTLAVSLEALRISGILLFPVMPEKMRDMLEILGERLPEDGPKWESLKWGGGLPEGARSGQAVLKRPPPLFPKRQER